MSPDHLALDVPMLEGRVVVQVPGALLAQCFGMKPDGDRHAWAAALDAHEGLLRQAARLQIDALGWAPAMVLTEYYIALALQRGVRSPG
jgi:hypothetical protein